ncbi:hypothetical protein N7509_011170 [Penicillium cosmopolitanum]|uniref:Uncharacterized protein n=1 Tax=Penicillium cosmopolitanum TaxID=1131564 RepID=A0A9W9VSZ0_9EURO|nr:uncharacterized protein N7509_011170 [Penicillium cosmopolitanum]KAJ5388629.1 hypothetical protein N7509_011170 [Penicillium cosmopolitanum]
MSPARDWPLSAGEVIGAGEAFSGCFASQPFIDIAPLFFDLNHLEFYLKNHGTSTLYYPFHDLHGRTPQACALLDPGPELDTEHFQHSHTHSSNSIARVLFSGPALNFHYS